MKKLLFISLFAALIAAGCSKDEGPGGQGPKIPGNEIWYTSSDGKIVEPYSGVNAVKYPFGDGVEIVSNTYENGKGIIKFSAPVTEIGMYAFAYCDRLTSITIPDSVTTIGYDAFFNCSSLTAFYGKFASADNRCLIVDGVLTSFAPAGLTEYTIPDSVTTIGYDAFAFCHSLTSVTIPDSVTKIGDRAFFDCSSLTSVTIPDSVTTIGYDAFFNCSSLTSVTIPDSVTKIGDDAFFYCSSLTSVYCKATTPPTFGSDVFKDYKYDYTTRILPYLTAIYVPRASVEAYKAAKYWSEYADLIRPYDF